MAAPQSTAESSTARAVAELLSRTLGREKSEEVVASASQRLGFTAAALTAEQGLAILDDLSHEAGIVGVTARFARARADFGGHAGGPASAPAPASSVRLSTTFPQVSPPRALPLAEVVALLSPTLGLAKSEEAILASARRLALPRDAFDAGQIERIFDDLASQPGLVGVTARFAKARLHLKLGS